MKKKLLPPIPVTFDRSDRKPPVDEQYFLTSAISFYHMGAARRTLSPDLAMHHVARTDGTLCVGKPIDPIALAKTLYRLQKGEMVEKLVLTGEHVLAENRDAVLWWRPASVTPLYFKTAEPVPELTALNGVPLPQPALVFKAGKGKNAGLHVWALITNERPTATTPLYHAPYMNIGESLVCLGSARSSELANLKKAGPSDWENLFFNSNFSHTPPPLNYALENKTPSTEAGAEKKAELVTYASILSLFARSHHGDPSHHVRPSWDRYLLRSGKRTLADVL